MAFDVYPNPASPTTPLNVLAGATSTAINLVNELHGPFEVVPGIFQETMFIRVVEIGACAAPAGAEPKFILQAGTGPEVTLPPPLPSMPTDPQPILNAVMGAQVANAQILSEANRVYLIRVFLISTGNTWKFKVQNNDAVARDFTWVVADGDTASKKPWLDVPTTLDYASLGSILVNDVVNHTLTISNKGTGNLNITDLAGAAFGTHFTIFSVPGPIAPNACGDITLQFTAPATIGAVSAPYSVGSDDTKAGTIAGHNHAVTLKATASQLEIAMVLDASGSMAFTPDGSSVPPAKSDTRWGKVTAAASQFLDLLQFFAGGRARIAMVVFPDTTRPPFPPPSPELSAKVIQSSINVPDNVTTLKNLLDNFTPQANFGWTTMGHGIGTAMGSIAGSFGEFQGSPGVDINQRWMVMMSDGAQNLGSVGTADHPTFYYGTGSTSFKGKKIKVFAAAYGDEGAVNWPPDHPQMQTLRTESNGIYSDAGTNDLGTDPLGDLGLNVFKSFRSAITGSLALDPTIDPGGVLTSSNTEERYTTQVLPYDTSLAFVVNWGSFSRERVSVQLLTPNCELITPEVALHEPLLAYIIHPRYAMYTVEEGFLSNAVDLTHPRYGTWTLIVQGNGLAGADREAFEHEIITRSRLKMKLDFGQTRYYTGNSISLTAYLSLDGKPLTNAHVTWQLSAPGQSQVNWLALSKVSTTEYLKAAKDFQGADVTPLVVKAHALVTKSVNFVQFYNPNTATLVDANGDGHYTASTGVETVPGPYNFRVTATGTTPDGLAFRREQQVQTYLTVRPDPGYTLFDTLYTSVLIENQRFEQATVRVWPRDQFGNVVLVDPDTNPAVVLNVRGAEAAGPLIGNLDGSYSRVLRYPPGSKPAVSLQVGDEVVIAARPIQTATGLPLVNQVIDFRPGREAEPSANQHADPRNVLGDLLNRPSDQFVSLGGFGSITLGVEGKYILPQVDDDITVFIQPDDCLRPYLVEAQGQDQRWVSLGKSAGVTQSFNLASANLNAARAVRITDASGQVLDIEFKSSPTPGVSVLALGYKLAGDEPATGPRTEKGCLAILFGLIDSLFHLRKKN